MGNTLNARRRRPRTLGIFNTPPTGRKPATAEFGRTGFLARPDHADGLGSPSYFTPAQSRLVPVIPPGTRPPSGIFLRPHAAETGDPPRHPTRAAPGRPGRPARPPDAACPETPPRSPARYKNKLR